MSPDVPGRRWASGKRLLGVVGVSAFAALAGAVALPPSAPIKDKTARVEVRRTAADWIELGLMSALACHGGPLLSGEDRPQAGRAP